MYYRNTHLNVGNFTIGELTRALDDSAAFFDGPANDSQKQEVLKQLIDTAKKVVSPLRLAGYDIEIVRTFSEGGGNHETGKCMDIAPSSRSYEDCYEIAQFLIDLGYCEQVWIEASDDNNNFHVHVKVADKETSPDKRVILDPEGNNQENDISWKNTYLNTYRNNTND